MNDKLSYIEIKSKQELELLLKECNELQILVQKQDIELKECNYGTQHMSTRYQELYGSYQSSLRKIESLLLVISSASASAPPQHDDNDNDNDNNGSLSSSLQQQVGSSNKNDEDDEENDRESEILGTTTTTTTVMERIKLFEKQGGMIASNSETTNQKSSSLLSSSSDLIFLRDFDMIVQKLGYDSNGSSSDTNISTTTTAVVVVDSSSPHGEDVIPLMMPLTPLISTPSSTTTTDDIRKRTAIQQAKRSAIVEAIFKRVDEHAYKMNNDDADADIVTSTPATVTTTTSTANDYFDLLHHFVQLNKVNHDVIRFSRFNNNNTTTTTPESNSGGRNDNRTTTTCIVGNNASRRRTAESSISKKNNHHAAPTTINRSRIEAARLQHGEKNLSQQINTNTVEIKSKTREKNLRLLELKYKNLREEYHSLKSSTTPIPPSDIILVTTTNDGKGENNCDGGEDGDGDSCEQPSVAVSSVTQPVMHVGGYDAGIGAGVNEMAYLMKQILEKERELEDHKSQVYVARKEKVMINNHLKTTTDNADDVSYPTDHDVDVEYDDYSESGGGHLWDIMSTSAQRDKGSKYDEDQVVDIMPSFDISHLTPPPANSSDYDEYDHTTLGDHDPISSTASSEHRDEKASRDSISVTTDTETTEQSECHPIGIDAGNKNQNNNRRYNPTANNINEIKRTQRTC